jgi:hypothetical protein
MFEQNVGDGANLFVTIVAVIIGFVAALGYLDKMRTSKKLYLPPELPLAALP